ncbi:glycoside hydrolase family 3 N-terminal domain-containing protein [Micromonospora sp. NPDC007271]|uniref:glycoside hydrolase family 3 protein n=1 Tax=Micromonospora sp. NPDC007271 TaxID=3154587 RepID=UPI0033E57F37
MTDRIPHRLDDLLARLTLPEKLGLLHQWQAPVPRLGLPAFRTGTEALHGVAWLGPATVFPQVVGLAATWNPDLIRAVGAAVGDEVRAKHHADPARVGLNVWAPVVNPLRDPRWGRNEEGWSEDPWLTGRLATAYAQGLRGDHPTRLRTAPTLKHFLCYNDETDRATTSSNLPPRVLHEYELPAFRAPVEAGAAVAVMASYNLVNGVPAHLSPLIAGELRGWTDDEIMVVGDAAAVGNIADVQAHLPDHVAGFAAALHAGVDSFTEDEARRPSPGWPRRCAAAWSPRPTWTARYAGSSAYGYAWATWTHRTRTRTPTCRRTWSPARHTGDWPARRPARRSCCCATTGCSPCPPPRHPGWRCSARSPTPSTSTGTAAPRRTRSACTAAWPGGCPR